VSLRLRVLAAFAYVLVLVIVALEVPLALSLSNRVDTEVEAEAAGRAQFAAAAANDSMGSVAALEQLVRQASRDLGGRVIIVGARGRLLADSAGEGLLSEPYGNRPEIRDALAGNVVQGRRRSDTLDQNLLYTAVPIVHEGRTVGAVRVTQSLAAVDARVRRNTLALVAVGAVALVLGLALAWLLAGSLARPLRALAGTARRLGHGDLGARAEVIGPSEQRDVARAFNEMAERLERVLAAQREFAANASHQLRTPLTGLRLRLEAASLKAGDPELERELAAAEREAERLGRLVGSLLALAREADRPELRRPTSLADACSRAADRWEAQAARNGQQLALATSEALALAAEDDVAIVLDNLVENALSYSPPGTTVTLECGRDGAVVRLAVSDEGPGLAEDEEERVWERFARGSAGDRAAGTGLGLAVVRTLVERWDGEARLVRRAEGGTRAEVRFPAAEWIAAPTTGRGEAVRA
jgi:two-component system, OmpR family, sensor kinase